jgi:hypothetical protein
MCPVNANDARAKAGRALADAPIRLYLIVSSPNSEHAFDHHAALCLEVHLVELYLDQVVLGPAPRRPARKLTVLISRPVFLDGLALVGRHNGTNAAHCITMASKR